MTFAFTPETLAERWDVSAATARKPQADNQNTLVSELNLIKRPKRKQRRPPVGPRAYIRMLADMGIGDSIYVAECLGRSLSSCAHSIGGAGWMVLRREGLGYRLTKLAEPKCNNTPRPHCLEPNACKVRGGAIHCITCHGKARAADIRSKPEAMNKMREAAAQYQRTVRAPAHYAKLGLRGDEVEAYKALLKRNFKMAEAAEIIINSRRD